MGVQMRRELPPGKMGVAQEKTFPNNNLKNKLKLGRGSRKFYYEFGNRMPIIQTIKKHYA
jgi:hypothetical protein